MYRINGAGVCAGAAIALLIIASLLSGGVMHAIVPHEHGHTATGLAMWGDMHAALTNQYKILALALSGFMLVFALLALLRMSARMALATVSTEVPALNRLLKRGTPAYRVFG